MFYLLYHCKSPETNLQKNVFWEQIMELILDN